MSVIPIDLRDLAIESDLLPGDSPASIRIRAQPCSHGGQLRQLHPDDIGTYARVFLGRVREAGAWRGVAIKLQRDEVSSDFAYDHQIVAAKFDEELANHLDFHRSRPRRHPSGSGPLHTVSLLPRPSHYQGLGPPSLPPSEILPPCLLCLRGRHALRLRGRDGQPLQQGPPSGSQRYLESAEDDGSGRRYYSDHVDLVALSTVGRDPSACASCELRDRKDPNSCLANLRYINFFENRVLFYEPLDLSLHDALRWWKGERRALAPRPRRAMRAVEAKLRRLRSRGRHEARDQAALRSLLDLRLRVDLFQQAMHGVESLHSRGIPHLDINPENICLKVRAGRVEAQLIDLGMAANPKFTARDQHEKRLWPRRTDFAAEECQRLGVFSNRHLFVRLEPGRLAARIPACRGDHLMDESEVPAGTIVRFEVVSVTRHEICIPGFGSFPYQYEVIEPPEIELTSTTLELRILPERGLSADIFSLGMVLASLLFHETSGDDLRRELPKIEESLFAHWSSLGPDLKPIPGRILVRRALSRPDPHSRWFRQRVDSLGIYGAATPLAEELLGIALCALLRSEHHFPYLTDRGGDARLALRRFAADVRAVRRALEQDLLAIRFRETLRSRREALRHLAARYQIAIAPVLPGAIADACDKVRVDASPVQDAVRMLAADPGRVDVEILRPDDHHLSEERIAKLIQELDPLLDAQVPERFACTRFLWTFLEWLHPLKLDGGRIRQLLDCCVESRSQGDPIPMDPRREDEREMVTRLAGALEVVELIDRALMIYDRQIGRQAEKFWRKVLSWYRITIRDQDFRLLERGRDSLASLEASRHDSNRQGEQLRDRFMDDLERWQVLGGEWSRIWLSEPIRQATEDWTIRLPTSQDLWSRSRVAHIAGLGAFFQVLQTAMSSAQEQPAGRIMILSKATCDRLRETRALVPSFDSTAPVLGPAIEAEADFLLRRLTSRRVPVGDWNRSRS